MTKPYFTLKKPELPKGHRVILRSDEYEEDTVLHLSELPQGTQTLELSLWSGEDMDTSVDVNCIGYTPFTPEEEVKVKADYDKNLAKYDRRLATYQANLTLHEEWLQAERERQQRQQYEELRKKFETQ